MTRIRLAVITEIMAPYRMPLFNRMAEDPRVDLKVFFLSKTEPRRQWTVPEDQAAFPHEVVPGIHFTGSYRLGPVFWNPGLAGRLRRFRPEVLALGGWHHPSYWAVAHHARKTGIPALIWSESTSKDRRSSAAWREWIKRRMIAKAAGGIVPGTPQKEYLLSLGMPKDKIFVSPNSVDNGFFEKGAAAARSGIGEARKAWGLEGTVMLYVGRLVENKGIFDLIEAVGRLSAEAGGRVSLLVVGSGPKDSDCRRLAVRRGIRAHFAGHQEQAKLPFYYGSSDVLVLPTRSDPWGLVVNEAMASGLPVVTTDAAGCSVDLVQDGANGYVYPAGDVEELTGRLRLLAADRERVSRMGAESSRRIGSHSAEAAADGFIGAAERIGRGNTA